MPTVADFCEYLSQFAPADLAEDWDNVGLLIGRRSAAVRSVLTCLTLTPDVAEEAVSEHVQLVVSHHPLLFRGTKRIADDNLEGALLLRLIEAGVAVYSPHTAFDSAREGINQSLASGLGLQDIRPLRVQECDATVGVGRCGDLPSGLPLHSFLERVAAVVGADRLEHAASAPRPVQRVGIACGAGESLLAEAARQGCDTFLTGEARFHTVLDAVQRGLTLVLTGHFFSERPAVEQLAVRLAQQFPETQVRASRRDVNPLRCFVSAATAAQ